MQLTSKIHLLRHDFEISISPGKKIPRYVNSLVVFGDTITLIDSGIRTSHNGIFKYIISQKRDPANIDRLILSHSHPDHMGSAMEIKRNTGCRILAHKTEKQWFENIDTQVRERPVPGFYELTDESVTIDEFIADGQDLNLTDDVIARVIHSPGHSAGSVNLFYISEKILFTADSVPLSNDIPNYAHYGDLRKSLNQIKQNSAYEILLTSWTPPLMDRVKAQDLIREGERYLEKLDQSVKKNYLSFDPGSLTACKKVIEELGLPLFFINPVVDHALRTHLA